MESVTRKRSTYSAEYKAEMVNYVVTTGKPVAQAAKDMGLPEQTLGRWVKRHQVENPTDENGTASDPRAAARIKELERELAEAKLENEFLLKASAFFAARKRSS
jgi:transposase-like protein